MVHTLQTLFKAFLNPQTYEVYFKYLDRVHIKECYPTYFRIYNLYPELYEQIEEQASSLDVSELRVVYEKLYGDVDPETERIFNEIQKTNVTEVRVKDLLNELKLSFLSEKLAILYTELSQDGTNEKLLEDVTNLQKEFNDTKTQASSSSDEGEEFYSLDLGVLRSSRQAEKGLWWRLPSLNKFLGPLRAGDFGIIFARPETGKTTFLASEITFLATQELGGADNSKQILKQPSAGSGSNLSGKCVWFNNEERASKVALRINQGGLGVRLEVLLGTQLTDEQNKLSDLLRGRILLKDAAYLNKRDVERILTEHRPSLVVFDQLDKVTGFDGDRNDLEQKERYVWARSLAKKFNCVVLAVCQAGASGENKKWLTLNDMDLSKTAKGAEADFVLGIGKIDNETSGGTELRYLHLSKNKLDGYYDETSPDRNTDPSKRHNKWTVLIKPDIARYEDYK